MRAWIPATRLIIAQPAAAAPRLRGCAAETRSGARILITIKVYVVDAHFAGLNTTHYLLKVLVFDLQSITD
jgi:hypothetical protein